MRIRLLAALAAALIATGARAAVPLELAVRAGALVPTHRDASQDTWGAVDLAATWTAAPHVGLELAVGHQRLESQPEAVYLSPDRGIEEITYEVAAWHVDASAVFSLPFRRVEPFALFGIGWYAATVSGLPPASPYTRPQPGGTGYALAGHVGMGARVRVSERMFTTVDARYQVVEIEHFQPGSELDAVRVTGGVGWRF